MPGSGWLRVGTTAAERLIHSNGDIRPAAQAG